MLLGLIAQAITGRDYYELARERIYQRAGMAHADHFRRDDTAAGLAIGYLADGSDDRERLALRGSSAGGGYASAHDLLAFSGYIVIVQSNTGRGSEPLSRKLIGLIAGRRKG